MTELRQIVENAAVSVLDSSDVCMQIRSEIATLIDHPVYCSITTVERARVYMRYHVWCVWDFMSLVKAVQRGVTCVEVPWMPPDDTDVVAYINEILSSEESDSIPAKIAWGKAHASHFEVYLEAMRQAGADTHPMKTFLSHIRAGLDFAAALDASGAPSEAADFVKNTLQVARGPLHQAVSAFCIAREGIIPDMFGSMLSQALPRQKSLNLFRWYLERHIQVDSESHGPLSVRLFESVVGRSSRYREEAFQAALASLKARKRLLDGTHRAILDLR